VGDVGERESVRSVLAPVPETLLECGERPPQTLQRLRDLGLRNPRSRPTLATNTAGKELSSAEAIQMRV
jgi:hypothetical protein